MCIKSQGTLYIFEYKQVHVYIYIYIYIFGVYFLLVCYITDYVLYLHFVSVLVCMYVYVCVLSMSEKVLA